MTKPQIKALAITLRYWVKTGRETWRGIQAMYNFSDMVMKKRG